MCQITNRKIVLWLVSVLKKQIRSERKAAAHYYKFSQVIIFQDSTFLIFYFAE